MWPSKSRAKSVAIVWEQLRSVKGILGGAAGDSDEPAAGLETARKIAGVLILLLQAFH